MTEQDDTFGTAWCPECRRTRDVVDQFEDSHYEPRGEVGMLVTIMACGHNTEDGEHVVGPAPGAPYAGPDRTVAASMRPADLRAARSQQPPEDPWT